MENLFFSKENFGIIYKIVRKKVLNKCNYDISNDESFNKQLVNIMKSMYARKNSFNLASNLSNIERSRYLSQKCINISIPYFEDTISKLNNSNYTPINSNSVNENKNSHLRRKSLLKVTPEGVNKKSAGNVPP